MRSLGLLVCLLVSAPAWAQERKLAAIPEPGVSPSIGVLQGHVFWKAGGETQYTSSIPLYLGATFHPMPARFSPFSNVGIEMDYYPYGGGVEWVPMGRFGVAILAGKDDGEDELLRRMFPAFQLYGIAGYRIPSGGRGGAARLGVGIGSPFLMAATMGETCVPAPMMLEATMDVSDTKGSPRDYQLRVGWFF